MARSSFQYYSNRAPDLLGNFTLDLDIFREDASPLEAAAIDAILAHIDELTREPADGAGLPSGQTKSPQQALKPCQTKSRRRLRRSDRKDKQVIDAIRNLAISDDESGEPSLVSNPNTPNHPIELTSKPASRTPSLRSPLDTPTASLLSTSWGDTSDRAKLTFACEALEFYSDEDRGSSGKRPVAWTLNIGPERHAEALAHPKGFAGCLGGYIRRALVQRFGKGNVPLFFFRVEATKAGRLHLHGVSLVSPDQDKDHRAALIHAGGKWGNERGKEYQLDCLPDRGDYGWITYASKNRRVLSDLIGDRDHFISKELRKKAGDLYGDYRRTLRALVEKNLHSQM